MSLNLFPNVQFWVYYIKIKEMFFYSNFTGSYTRGTNWQYVSIGSGDNLAPNWRQAINRINDDKVIWRHIVSLVHH